MRLHKVCHRLGLGLVAALVLIGGIGQPIAYAADSYEEMTISPTDKHLELEAGAELRDSFVILNSGHTAYDFSTYTSPYSVNAGDYSAKYDADAPRSDAYKWVQMDTTQWHANVRETVTIPFVIRVPKNAAPGSHYGVIFAETKASTDASGIMRNKRLGMILLITVKGTAVNDGHVASIDTSWFRSRAPIESTISVEDKGNTDFAMQTYFTVSDLFGGKKYESASEFNVFPDTHRDVTISWDDAPWFGIFRVHTEATALGKMTARDSYVLVAPYWLFMLVGLAVIMGVINVVRHRKNEASRFRKRK